MTKMTATKHLIGFLKLRFVLTEPAYVITHEIQELSHISKGIYGRYLGSPSSYERIFRKLRNNGIIEVKKLSKKEKPYKTREAIYEIIKVNTHNLFQF